MRKTAMQEYLEVLQNMYNDPGMSSSVKDGLYISIQIAVNQLKSLETEKQQIIEAWNNGHQEAKYDNTPYHHGNGYFIGEFQK